MQQPPVPPPIPTVVVRAPQRCGLATASLVFGILSLCLLGPLGAIPAMICGGIALSRIRDSEEKLQGKGLALAGLALGGTSLVLSMMLMIVVIRLPAAARAEEAMRLPAAARAEEAAQRSSCAGNLKQMGLVCKMFANENKGQYFPELSPEPGRLMCAAKDIYPKYLTDANVLVCPSDSQTVAKSREAGADPAKMIDDGSYVYLGYVITSDDEMEAFAEVYKRRVAQRLPFNEDLDAPPGRGSVGTAKFYRLREGVVNELLKGSQDPGAIAKLQSQIPIMWDKVGIKPNAIFFNHLPGGSNILFMDGHVEFQRYPGPWPISRRATEILSTLSSMRS